MASTIHFGGVAVAGVWVCGLRHNCVDLSKPEMINRPAMLMLDFRNL